MGRVDERVSSVFLPSSVGSSVLLGCVSRVGRSAGSSVCLSVIARVIGRVLAR